MDSYTLIKTGKKYSIKMPYADEFVAENLSLPELAAKVAELYKDLVRPEHRNPDRLPEHRGIDFRWEGNIEKDKGLSAIVLLSRAMNDVYAKLDSAEEMIEIKERTIEGVRRAVGPSKI